MSVYAQLPARCLALAASTPGSVLLETSRPDAANYHSYLFLRPTRILAPGNRLFDEIQDALAAGSFVAGFLTYECGEGLKNLGRPAPPEAITPRAWFGVYPEVFVFDHRMGEFEGQAPGGASGESPAPEQGFEIRNPHFGISELEYARRVAAIQEHIRSGDTYQVNFTDRLDFDFKGTPAAMFAALSRSQPVPYSAFIHGEGWHVLSFSPELFFRVKERTILARPMKGTARRGADTAEDESIAGWLHHDSKSRSENVMIVDLVRNDLGRICEYGSVRAGRLFAVEKYETLFQMTSEVSGTLRPSVRHGDLFESLFPCGSVTGAPKHRTLEIIEEMERGPRGVYTGAIGFFSPAREAVFNVPIRTVVLKGNRGSMGVGSGIVIESQASEELRECLLKSDFLTGSFEPFQILESILWDGGYQRLPEHLERMEKSASYFEYRFDRPAVLSALGEHEKRLTRGVRSKVRLLLDRSGAVTITHTPVPEQADSGEAIVASRGVFSGDRFLRHKTTRRQLYDEFLALAREQGYEEAIFLNERGEVTEGAISNVFIEKDGRWFTPPVSCGLLPGIFRRHLLATKPASEAVLRREDLASADAVYICNAVRGCRQVRVAQGLLWEGARPAADQME